MSHDRKPGRVQVVKAGGGSSQRRRGGGSAGPGSKNDTGKAGRLGQAMLIVLFLLAAAGGAVSIELYLPR